ncbi:MAG: pyruvate dehydrogenase (acetyl-transferring) E1 component subunit alpha [Propionibacteriaceae bacterium]
MSDPVEMVQLLTPEGERVEHPDFKYTGSDEDILALFRDMVMARRFDVEGTLLQRQGELGLWPPLLGQEASQVGSGRAVKGNDMVFPSYREHGVAWVCGVDPGEVMGMWRGTHMASWNSREKRFHNYTVIIGAQALHATGYAMGMQRDGMVGNANPDDNGACLVYFGDGATSQGDVSEAFVFANSYQSPVVFFVSNNQWAISEPVTLQSRIPLYQRAAGFGMPGIRVDGNDVLAVKAVTEWALERARSGQGPCMIESYTYRMGPHTTSDDPTKYRLAEETEAWKAKDPIERVKRYLLARGLIDDAYLAKLDEEGDDLGEHLRNTCKTLPDPPMSMIWDNTYVTKTPTLEREAAGYAAYAASFEENH